MSSYPVLNNRPIDQWRVTDLKDELRTRKLPVKGLKDELVRRLFDSIQSEKAVDETDEDVGVNAPVNQAPENQNVSQKTTVSVTEVCQETVVHVTQEATIPLTEAIHEVTVSAVEEPPRVNVVATHEAPLSEAPTAKGEEPESVAGDNSTVQEGSNTEPVVEKAPEIGTNETIVVNDVTSAVVKSDMISPEVKSDATEASKIQKQDTVPLPVDALTSDTNPMDTDGTAAPIHNDREKLVPKSDLSDNTSVHDEECKDSEHINEECKPIISKPNNQVEICSHSMMTKIWLRTSHLWKT